MRTAFLLVAMSILIAGCTSNSCMSINGKCTYNDVEYFPHCEGNNVVTYECEDGCMANSVPCLVGTCKVTNSSGWISAACE